MNQNEEIVIFAGRRSPIGAFQGSLSPMSAPRIAAPVIKSCVESAHLGADEIGQIFMGEVLSAGVGQAPARQALIYSGLPNSIPATTINKVCGSGLQAVYLASMAVKEQPEKAIVAGGMESMTQGPYLLPTIRRGARLGHAPCIDSVVHDGLWDCYNDFHMGNAGELCAEEYKFSRQMQDEFAALSYSRAQKAVETGLFKNEVVPIDVVDGKKTLHFDVDEEPGKGDPKKMAALRPAFSKEGTITAGNASSLSDGASATLVATANFARRKGIKSAFAIRGFSHFAHQPQWFTTAPVGALKLLEQKTGKKIAELDAIEINEAFAVVPMVAIKELKLNIERVNPRGGAIALGHPIGCSGNRILVTLMHTLESTSGKWGAASLCIGGGEGIAILVERVSLV